MTRTITIGGIEISDDSPAFVIAEIGHNHAGEIEKAKAMVLSARAAGASAVKFQTRSPRDVYSESEFNRTSNNPQWMDRVYGRHREKLEFTPDEWTELFQFCRSRGILAFSTPFDFKSVDLLESLDVPAFKVASGDATNTPMIEYIARIGKPMIISTGGCSIEDVDRIYDAVSKHGTPFVLLQCSCIYPAPSGVLNLKVIETYRRRYPEIVTGLSTHSPEIYTSLAAFALGGRVFEHHYTNDREWKGTDNAFSLTPETLKELTHGLDEIGEALGNGRKYCFPEEEPYTIERRKKLVWAGDLSAGQIVGRHDLAIKCPGDGIQPYEIADVIGEQVLADVSAEQDVLSSDLAVGSKTLING